MAFQGVLVVTLRLCLSSDGVVHPRATAGFGSCQCWECSQCTINGWNCSNICLITQLSWTRNELGWNNRVCGGRASSDIYQGLTDAPCRDLGFFMMSWRSGRVFPEFLPSWDAEGSIRLCTSPITDGLGAVLHFGHRAVKSCSWLSPQAVWGTAQPLWYFPSEMSDQPVISWKLDIIEELPELGTFNFYLLFFPPKIYRRSLILY